METLNNCYLVDFNYTLLEKNHGIKVRGSAQCIVGFRKSEIHKRVQELVSQNIDDYWDEDRLGYFISEWSDVIIFIQVVNVIEFPASELKEWEGNLNKLVLKY